MDLWGAATPIADTLAGRYLAGRGIRELPPGIDGTVLRFHPACPYDGGRQPCTVALLSDIVSNAPKAVQRTALTAESKKIGRRTLGPKAGAAIKLAPNEDVAHRLSVGEGCETVLSGMALGYSPAWALGDAGELGRFPILPGVESITILTDHGAAGEAAAMACSAHWTGAGREVFRLVPREPGADVNDLLRGTFEAA
jgi:putative DNA primase/helicase